MVKKAVEVLFHHDQVIVLLAFLHQDVLAVNEIVLAHHLVKGDLVLVDTHAVALHHLARLALRGEDLRVDRHEIHNRDAGFQGFEADLLLRNAVKHIEEGLLVELHEGILGGFAKKDVGGFDGSIQGFLRVNHHRDFLSQALLKHTTTRILLMLSNQSIDGLFLQRGENLDVFLGILIADIEPELVELVWRGALRIEPNVATFGLAEFLAIGLGDQGASQGKGLVFETQRPANQLRTRGDVAPLVVASELQLAVFVLVEPEEVIALEQLIGELGEAQSVAGGAIEALLNAVLRHHVIHGNVLAHLTGEVEEGEVLHPVVVVHHLGGIGFLRFKIKELGHLGLDALLIVTQRLFVQQVTFLALARRVANHASGTSHQDDGLVAAALQMAEHHNTTEMTDMQRVGSRVGAQVSRHHFFLEEFFRSWHHLCQHSAPAEFFNKVLHVLVFCGAKINKYFDIRRKTLSLRHETVHRNMKNQVVIIGAGPAGCVCGYLLRQAGVDCVIVDFATFPREKICGGGLTPKAYELLHELMPDLHYEYQGVNRFRLMMDGRTLCVVDLAKELRMVHRMDFDYELLKQYQAIGGTLIKDAFSSFEALNDGQIQVTLKSGTQLLCDYLIGADGANSRVRKQLTGQRPNNTLWMEQYVPKGANEFVFEFSNRYNKGYYFCFPSLDHDVVGMGGFYSSPEEIRTQFRHNVIRKDASVSGTALMGAHISVDTVASEKRNVILIGDAGGFANKVTYEGLYYAIATGRNASKAILEGKDFTFTNREIFRKKKRKEVFFTRLIYSRLGLSLMKLGAHSPRLIKKAFEMNY